MSERKNIGWIKFVPSLNLPKERVSIAYDTHDERGIRYAYGYFQFYNGTCGCFWKDGNEQPKVVKAEDIKYWMPVPSLDVQEEPVSEQNLSNVERVGKNWKEPVSDDFTKALAECIHNAQCNVIDPMVFAETWKDELIKLSKCEEPVSEDLEEAANKYAKDYLFTPKPQRAPNIHFINGANWQKEQMIAKAVDVTIAIPYQNCYGGYTQLVDSKEGLPFGENLKVLVIKED